MAVIITALTILVSIQSYIYKKADAIEKKASDLWSKPSKFFDEIEKNTALVQATGFDDKLERWKNKRDLLNVLVRFTGATLRIWSVICVILSIFIGVFFISYMLNANYVHRENVDQLMRTYLFGDDDAALDPVEPVEESGEKKDSVRLQNGYSGIQEIAKGAFRLLLICILSLVPPWGLLLFFIISANLFKFVMHSCIVYPFFSYVMQYDPCFRKHCK